LKSKLASRVISERLLVLPDDCRILKSGQQRRAFWQPRCYDHNCRTRDTVLERINYCHNNPVARGLVDEPGQWRWSSYNWYAGRSDVPLAMDELDSPAGT
jgi:REP element-mobilizing transposase RayT